MMFDAKKIYKDQKMTHKSKQINVGGAAHAEIHDIESNATTKANPNEYT